MPDFHGFSLPVNLLLFAAAAALVWLAGTRLSAYVDEVAHRTGASEALLGALLLGGITSLPEGATTVAASAVGNAPLAVNNILGGIAMQVTVLALADLVAPGRALSARIRSSVVLLEGAVLIAVLTVVAAGMAVGDVLVAGVGVWSAAVLCAAVWGFRLIQQHKSEGTWTAEAEASGDPPREEGEGAAPHRRYRAHSATRLWISTGGAALAILVAGVVLAHTGDALSEQSGIGANFVGVLFLAFATSLPEISTTIAAVRLGQVAMAFSNIFGANILDASILFLADVAFPGGPVLNQVDASSLVASLLGIGTTSVYLVGLLRRRRRVVLGAGLDSLLVLAVYATGLAILYRMR